MADELNRGRTLRQMIDKHFATTTREERRVLLAKAKGPASPEEEFCFGGAREEFLDPAFNRVSIDEVLLADLRIDGDAGEVPLFAIPLDGSDGAGHASLGKDHRCIFGRQGMSRLVAFCRVIARRVVYGVVHTYSKRTTLIGWGMAVIPNSAESRRSNPNVRV